MDSSPRAKDGQSPLHRAAINGYVPVVKKLLESNANVNAQDEYGVRVIDYDVERQGFLANGFSPLYYAAENNHIHVAKLLISNGANVKIRRIWAPVSHLG
ncbi:MAG: ankyrin repeat domain-containing protein [Deltaproteobacteria bacterium]|nr:ankyrin repeat domain-containing protein [Deltaproteobacteria bacterium]